MPTDRSDKDRIIQFLSDSKDIFSDIVSRKNYLFTPTLLLPIEKAWEIIEKNISKLISQLEEYRYDLIQPYLSDAGLASDELNFKLAGFYECKFLWDGIKKISQSLEKLPWKKLLKNLLEWINIILSSLDFMLGIFSLAFSSIQLTADPIREFKDAIEAGINLKEISDKVIKGIHKII